MNRSLISNCGELPPFPSELSLNAFARFVSPGKSIFYFMCENMQKRSNTHILATIFDDLGAKIAYGS